MFYTKASSDFASLLSMLTALTLVLSGCDVSGAQETFKSTGVIVAIESIETTVTGQLLDANGGGLVEAPASIKFQGTDAHTVVDMYSDAIDQQSVHGGVASFGLQSARTPTRSKPLRIRMIVEADGYLPTSIAVAVHETGTAAFTTRLLSTDPRAQPEEASVIHNRSLDVSDTGTLAHDVNIQTPAAANEGSVRLLIPKEARLSGRTGATAIDLIHYPPYGEALRALPGNGALEASKSSQSSSTFALAGYAMLRIRGDGGFGTNENGGAATGPRMRVHFADGAVHPGTGAALQAGDELTLYRYDPSAGTWASQKTVRVRPRRNTLKASAASHRHSAAAKRLGIEWGAGSSESFQLWAWGAKSGAACSVAATVDISPNARTGSVQGTLRRPGQEYTATIPIDKLADGPASLATLFSQSTLPEASDYSLVITTPDGKTTTIENVSPCSGTYSAVLPAAPSTSRTDVLFRGTPDCPGDQKVRLTSLPTFTVYYRQQDAASGTPWHIAGDERITWVLDDPDTPTHIKFTELRLDGLKQDTRYEVFTTYNGDRREAAALVPTRDEATIEEDRVVVSYSRDFANACS